MLPPALGKDQHRDTQPSSVGSLTANTDAAKPEGLQSRGNCFSHLIYAEPDGRCPVYLAHRDLLAEQHPQPQHSPTAPSAQSPGSCPISKSARYLFNLKIKLFKKKWGYENLYQGLHLT